MERLTNQEIAKELKQNVEATITTTQNVSRYIYLRFAEFEDFMEQEEFTSLEDLKAYIKLQSKGSNDLMQENQALKDR